MSDEVGVTEYVAAPRGDRRVDGVEARFVDDRLSECSEFFHKHVDETDYRNLDWYLQRASLRFAVGDDIIEVLDDLFLAARCLHDRHAMHLELKPPEMFMTRRIVPVELGIISGMPMLTMEFSATYGLPLMMVLGKTASEEIMSEACLLSTYFRSGLVGDFYELAGVSAVIYAGVIAAIGRGFDDEAILALNRYAKARDSLRGMPPAAALTKIRRYDALNTALACLCNGDFGMIGELLAPVAEDFLNENRKKFGDDEFFSPSKSPSAKYFDVSILTILALVALREKQIQFPQTGALAAYRDFELAFTEMPQRRIEVPGLDEEARRILQEAGIDPDALENQGQADTSARDEKAESEARALALLQERQRQAQEAVKKKLLQREDEEEEELQGENFQQPVLKLREEDEDSSQPTERKDFGNFFEDLEDAPAEFEEEPEEAPKPKKEAKDFSAFFDTQDKDDVESRQRHEEEDSSQADAGQSYSDFFEKLDEEAIPKFDDGSRDDIAAGQKEFSASFFDEDAQTPAFKMQADEEQKPQAVSSSSTDTPEAQSHDVASSEPSRSYAQFFSHDSPHKPALKMSLEPEEEVQNQPEKPKAHSYVRETSPAIEQDLSKVKDFSKLFDEEDAAPTDLIMHTDADKDKVLHTKAAETEPQAMELVEEPQEAKDYAALFEELEPQQVEPDDKEQSEVLRELEEYQRQKRLLAAQAHGPLQLELEEGAEAEQALHAESAQERLARLIAERDEQARAAALAERERQEQEIARLAALGPQDLKPEALKLSLEPSTDPDEIHEKVQPEDMRISPFVYTDLDMIHENTALKPDMEEDVTVHDVVHQLAGDAQTEKVQNDDDDSLLITLNYDESGAQGGGAS